MKKIVECVPNFSEGRDTGKIAQIAAEVEAQLKRVIDSLQ